MGERSVPWERERCQYHNDAGRCTGVRWEVTATALPTRRLNERVSLLTKFQAEGNLDFVRGVPLTEEHLAQILEHAPALDAGRRLLKNADFTLATFTGDASFRGAAIFQGDALFRRATFGGDAWFDGSTFEDDAWFREATFVGGAWFDGATFARYAWFGRADFRGNATFERAALAGEALFDETSFARNARFDGATFGDGVNFDGATFGGEARFGGAAFKIAEFRGTTFAGLAMFGNATFEVHGRFDETIFSGYTVFDDAVFSEAWFDEATFASHAGFQRAVFTRYVGFAETTFSGHTEFRGAKFAPSIGISSSGIPKLPPTFSTGGCSRTRLGEAPTIGSPTNSGGTPKLSKRSQARRPGSILGAVALPPPAPSELATPLAPSSSQLSPRRRPVVFAKALVIARNLINAPFTPADHQRLSLSAASVT